MRKGLDQLLPHLDEFPLADSEQQQVALQVAEHSQKLMVRVILLDVL